MTELATAQRQQHNTNLIHMQSRDHTNYNSNTNHGAPQTNFRNKNYSNGLNNKPMLQKLPNGQIKQLNGNTRKNNLLGR